MISPSTVAELWNSAWPHPRNAISPDAVAWMAVGVALADAPDGLVVNLIKQHARSAVIAPTPQAFLASLEASAKASVES